MVRYLITGGAGFVGSHLACHLRQSDATAQIVCLDNLKRRGSELNVSRLKAREITFQHGDIRILDDVLAAGGFDVLLECSAEPSVLAGLDGTPDYLLNTNLMGTVNCLEATRRQNAAMIFVSTSRVYPMRSINQLNFVETETRFELTSQQTCQGVSPQGYSEEFPLHGARSLYGATKLASELLIHEYIEMYGIQAVINRCGVLAGPWQFGKTDQGFVPLWVIKHHRKGTLSYLGFGGQGKQVRDVLHVSDLCRLIDLQLANLDGINGEVYNVGGGREVSVSLAELTTICQEVTGNDIDIQSVPETRALDIRIYLSDCHKVNKALGWNPVCSVRKIVEDIHCWIKDHETQLRDVWQ